MAKSSELKSEALLEQMKLLLSFDAGKHLTKNIGLVYQLNIAPKKIRLNEDIYVVDLKKGEVKKGPYKDEKPDAIFSFTDEDFFKIASRKMNPLIAFMRGAMKVKSSLSTAQKFTPNIFPKPSKMRGHHCSVYVASQTASQKDTRSSPTNGQNFATQKDDSSEELDVESLEAAIMQMMYPGRRLCYRWLRGLPIDWNQHDKDVQRCLKATNKYSRRRYPTCPIDLKQQPFFAGPLASQTTSQEDTRSSTANGQSFAGQKDDFTEESIDGDSLEAVVMQRMCFKSRLSYKWLRRLLIDWKKLASKAERVSSWIPGVPDSFVIKTKELDMVPEISKTQRRKIQRRYTKYQRNLKESGESSSLAQSKGQAEEKESPKLAPQIKRSANRE